MLCLNLGSTEVEALSLILYYLSHLPHGSFEVYLSEAYANGSISKVANIAYRVRHCICDSNRHKSQALEDHLAENPIDEEYDPLKTYFTDEEVSYVNEVVIDVDPGWNLFFDGAINMKGFEIGAVFISELGQYFSITAQL